MFLLKIVFTFVLLAKDCSVDQPKWKGDRMTGDRMIPGLEQMNHGIDITQLDLWRINGFLSPIFEFTYNSDRKWYHGNAPNVDYNRPDQVLSIDSVAGGSWQSKSHFYKSITDVKASLMASVGMKFGPDTTNAHIDKFAESVVGSFSGSVSFVGALNAMFAQNTSTYEIFANVTTVKITLDEPPFLTLSKAFLDNLNELTGTYDEQPEMYDRIVQKYGTHFFITATFGGIAKQIIEIKNEYIAISEENELSSNIEASCFSIFNVDGSAKIVRNEDNQKFKENSISNFDYIGGVTNIPSTNGKDNKKFFTKWVPKVNKEPRLLSGRLSPIESLVDNGKIRAQLQKASAIYRMRAYYGELKMTLTLSGFNFTDQQQLSKLDRLTKMVEQKQFNNIDEMVHDTQYLLNIIHEAFSGDLCCVRVNNYNKFYIRECKLLRVKSKQECVSCVSKCSMIL